MLVTRTTNIHQHERIYLGGTGSFEAYIEKAADGRHWHFRTNDGIGGCHLSEADKRACSIYWLANLCDLLGCGPDDLTHIPFQVIQSLHVGDERHNRRMASPRKTVAEHCYVSTAPKMHRPKADFTAEHFEQFRRQR